MLLVNAKKGPSKIHGMGLIAHQFIPKGTRMWQFQDGFDLRMSPTELDKLSLHAKEQMLFYCYYDPRSNQYILSSDDDRFTNHSETPNCALDDDGDSTIAITDIAIGEEITWDYRPWGGLEYKTPGYGIMPHEMIYDERA